MHLTFDLQRRPFGSVLGGLVSHYDWDWWRKVDGVGHFPPLLEGLEGYHVFDA